MNKILPVAMAVASLAAGASQSATTTTTFAVTSTVLATCKATAAPLLFGNYTPAGGSLLRNSVISVKCTKSTPYTIALSVGTTAGAAYAQRLMTSGGANTLQYNLYTLPALSNVFGDGTGSTATVAGTGTGVATAVDTTVYGQLLDSTANQAAAPGNYSDSITVTVTY